MQKSKKRNPPRTHPLYLQITLFSTYLVELTGEIFLALGQHLDYEERSQYQFQVLVQNPNPPDSTYSPGQIANVTINVLDGTTLLILYAKSCLV